MTALVVSLSFMLHINHVLFYKPHRLKSVHVTDEKLLDILLPILQLETSSLRELCLHGSSNIGTGLHYYLFAVLGSPSCKLQTLRSVS